MRNLSIGGVQRYAIDVGRSTARACAFGAAGASGDNQDDWRCNVTLAHVRIGFCVRELSYSAYVNCFGVAVTSDRIRVFKPARRSMSADLAVKLNVLVICMV